MNLNGDIQLEDIDETKHHQSTDIDEKQTDVEVIATNGDGVVINDPNVSDISNQKEDDILKAYPEVVEDLKGIVVLEDALKELEYVDEDIRASGGINQIIAMEADRCIPGFINENKPIGFYTKAPSATNLKYALEAIDAKKTAIIAAIFASILAAFYKIYQWFKDSDSIKLTEEKEKLEKEINELTDKYRNADRNISGGIDKVMAEVANSDGTHANKIINDISGITHDILSSNSVLMKKIHSIFNDNGGARGFKILIADIETALDSIIAIAKKQIGSYKITDAIESETQIKNIIEGKHPATNKALNTLRYEGQLAYVVDISNDLKTSMNQLSEKRYKTTDFTSILVSIGSLLKSPDVKAIGVLNAIYLDALEHLNTKLEEIQKIVTSGKIETENHIQESPNYKGKRELTEAVRQLNNQILAIGLIISISYQIIIVHPKRTVRELRLAYDEAKNHLSKLKSELKSENSEKNADEIKRLEEWLSHFE